MSSRPSDDSGGAIDEALLERCRCGDRAALEQLVERVQGRVYNFAVRASGSQSAAEDITQRVLIKMVRDVSAFRAEASFTSWLYRIVVNEWIDEQRKLKRLLYWPVEGFARWKAGGLDPSQQTLRDEREAAVLNAVGRLEPKLRAVVLLRYLEEMSYDEVAAALGVSMGTVASRMSRAHARLKDLLGEYRHEV